MKANYYIAVMLLFTSSPLFAHTGGMFNETLWQSLIHPLTGIDHLLVLVSVGLLAAKRGSYAIVLYPLTFLVMMVLGAGLNFAGIQLPLLETMIALSVIFMGYSLITVDYLLSHIVFVVLSLFGVFHGYVHVSEIPDGINSLNYLTLLLLSSFVISVSAAVLGLFSEIRIYQLVTWVSLGSGFYLLAVS